MCTFLLGTIPTRRANADRFSSTVENMFHEDLFFYFISHLVKQRVLQLSVDEKVGFSGLAGV